MNTIIQILRYKLLWLVALLTVVISTSTIFDYRFALPGFGFLYLFMDMLGYYFLASNGKPTTKYELGPTDEVRIKAFRIYAFVASNVILGLVIALIWVLLGFKAALIVGVGSFLLWWFGVYEILYYKFYKLTLDKEWNWVYWTPVGILKALFKGKNVIKTFLKKDTVVVTDKEMRIQAALGTILVIAFLIII